MTLTDILDIVFKRIKLLVILPVVFFVASMVYSFEIVAPTYTSSATFMVLNQTYYDSITYNDLMIGSILINDYQYLATTSTVYREAAEKLGLDNLNGCSVNVSAVTDTRMIKLSVVSTDPEKAANVANALTEALINRISEIMKVENVTIVEYAKVPTGASGPNRSKIVFIATAVGLIIAIGIVIILEFMDNTLQTSEDVEKSLGIPVLAQISKIETEEDD